MNSLLKWKNDLHAILKLQEYMQKIQHIFEILKIFHFIKHYDPFLKIVRYPLCL